MFNPYAEFETPPDDAFVWRYMSLEKFLALLASGRLHLTRLDQFIDPFEGRSRLVLNKRYTRK